MSFKDYRNIERSQESISRIPVSGVSDSDILLRNSLSSYVRFGKPFLDFIIALNAILCFSIIMIIISIIIKATSKGPVIFCQKRIGLSNKEFVIYKFRSMCVDAPVYSKKPDSGAPCITLVGKWLRKISLDELPQFFNVLKGDMSIVGPRPEMPFLVEEYDELENQRHLVKPGITGLWQISEKRSKAIRDGIYFDLEYLKTISFITDLKILFRTLKVFVKWNTH